MKISFRVGSGHKTYDSRNNEWSNFIAGKVIEGVATSSIATVKDKGEKIAAELQKAGNRELRRAAIFAANLMIGITSKGGNDDVERISLGALDEDARTSRNATGVAASQAQATIPWMSLTRTTRWRKTQNKNKFFLHKGDLKNAVRNAGPAILEATGGVQVKVVTSSDTIKSKAPNGRTITLQKYGDGRLDVAEIHVNLITNKVSTGMLPGLTSGTYAAFDPTLKLERRIFKNQPDIIEKLQGPSNLQTKWFNRHRPLMQPVIGYFLLFKVPGRLNNVFRQLTQAGRRGAGEEFSARGY